MPYRYTNIRIVDPATNCDTIEHRPLNLWWVAHAAAEETMQGGPLTSAWLQLFQAHLSSLETGKLRWGGDLAESAEMRRAYSAMYGRYFSRALLASRFGITDFVPLRRNCTQIQGGVTVSRTKRGDIPDWIAWDPVANSYVLAEAKGCLTGNDQNFLYRTPTCIGTGKAQFSRVEVRDSHSRKIRTRNWVAANLWSTDERRRKSVSVLWDPEEDGEDLSGNEIPRNAAAIRGHRIANIAIGLGRPESLRPGTETFGQTIRISIEPSEDAVPSVPATVDVLQEISEVLEHHVFPPIEKASLEAHEDVYVVTLITPFGIRPILNSADIEAARFAQVRARERNEPAMIYGLSINALATRDYKQAPWLSAGGIVSPDGAGLFDLKEIQLNEE